MLLAILVPTPLLGQTTYKRLLRIFGCLNKSGYGPLPIAILVQSFVVFYLSPVNRAQARQHWGCSFRVKKKGINKIFPWK